MTAGSVAGTEGWSRGQRGSSFDFLEPPARRSGLVHSSRWLSPHPSRTSCPCEAQFFNDTPSKVMFPQEIRSVEFGRIKPRTIAGSEKAIRMGREQELS